MSDEDQNPAPVASGPPMDIDEGATCEHGYVVKADSNNVYVVDSMPALLAITHEYDYTICHMLLHSMEDDKHQPILATYQQLASDANNKDNPDYLFCKMYIDDVPDFASIVEGEMEEFLRGVHLFMVFKFGRKLESICTTDPIVLREFITKLRIQSKKAFLVKSLDHDDWWVKVTAD